MQRSALPMNSGAIQQQMRGVPHPQQPGQKKNFSQVSTQGMTVTAAQQLGRPVNFNARNKKRRFSDKVIQPEIRALVPEAEAYMGLLSFEQKLDTVLTRKRLDIQEALKRPVKVKRKLRIYVSHSFTAGKEPERDGEEGSVPMWELRVEGRLLEDQSQTGGISSVGSGTSSQGNNPASVGVTSSKPGQPKRKFSSFFKSLVIELDKDIYGPDNHLVEWHRTPTTNETDGFQVKRPGDKDVKCTILLLLDHQPMKFKLHQRLAKLLGIAMETRPKIIEALWQYIKTHKLQDATDRDVINCDQFLEQIFNCKRIRFMEIPQRLQALLLQPDPLVLNHIIKYDGSEKNTACYDIEVELDDPMKHQMATFLQNHANMQDLGILDQKICDIIEQLNEWKTRRDFFAHFSEDPHNFIQKWLISQSRDLKNVSEFSSDYELERRSENYFQPHIQEGVYRYIYGKVQQKRFELEATLGVKNN